MQMERKMTCSVKDGGRLCTCGHMKCQHEDGDGYCIECVESDHDDCAEFVDRAPETVAA